MRRTLLLVSLVSSTLVGQTMKDGWVHLLNNRTDSAITVFENLSQDKDGTVAAQALRGLYMVRGEFLQEEFQDAPLLLKAYTLDNDPYALTACHGGLMNWARYTPYPNDSALFSQLTKVAKTPHQLQGIYQDLLLDKYRTLGMKSAADSLLAAMKVLTQWQMIGPFDNISNNGFSAQYGPEKELLFGKEYEGKDGRYARWHALRGALPSGWIHLENHTSSENAVYYFHTTIESPQQQEAILSFGSSSTFKVFHNGALVMADSVWRNTGIDSYQQKVVLRKGRNDLVVKVGHEARQYANFNVRFLDTTFQPLDGLTITKAPTDLATYPVAMSPTPAVLHTATEAVIGYFDVRLAEDPLDYEAVLLLASLLAIYEQNDKLQELLAPYLAKFPQSALLHGLSAEGSGRAHLVTEAQFSINEAFRVAPNYFPAWSSKLKEEVDKEDSKALETFLASSSIAQQKSLIGQLAYITLYEAQNRHTELFATLDMIQKKWPTTSEAVWVVASIKKAVGKNPEALKVLKTLLKTQQDKAEIYTTLAAIHLEMGNADSALAILEIGAKHVPDDPSISYKRGHIYYTRGDYEKSLAEAQKTLAIIPEEGNTMSRLGDIYENQDKLEEAKKVYEEKIRYTSNDYIAWDKLWKLQNKPSITEIAPLPSVDSLVNAARPWLDSIGESAIVARIEDVMLYPSPSAQHRNFVLIYLVGLEDIEYWKEYTFDLNGVFQTFTVNQAYTLKKNGKTIKADQSENELVYKSLEPHDFLVLEYTLYDYYQGALAGEVDGDFGFRLAYPSFTQKLRLIAPQDKKLPYTLHSSRITPKVTSVGDFTVTEIALDKDAGDDEDLEFVPADYPTREKVTYSTFADWGEIVSWYDALSSGKAEASPAMRLLADSLFAKATTPQEKVVQVHRFMSENITYSSVDFRQSGWIPQAAAEVLATRIGDCKDMSVLGKTLLALGGVQSSLVLVNTKEHSFVTHAQVGPAFDHCILAIPYKDAMEYVDFTSAATQFGTILPEIQGAKALVISPGNKSLITLPSSTPIATMIQRDMTITLLDDLSMKRHEIATRSGSFAAYYRAANRAKKAGVQQKEFQKELSEIYPGAQVTTFETTGLDELSDYTRSVIAFIAPDAVTREKRKASYDIYFPDQIEKDDYPSDTDRVEIVDLADVWWKVSSCKNEIVLTFPAGWKLLTPLEDVTVKTDRITYSRTFTPTPEGVIVKRHAQMNFPTYLTPEEYKKEFVALQAIVGYDEVELLFKAR